MAAIGEGFCRQYADPTACFTASPTDAAVKMWEGACPSHIWICRAVGKCFSGRYLPVSTAVRGCHRRGVLPPVCGSHGVFHRCTNRRCGKNVGGGLPPIAVNQCPIRQLTHRYRGQAPSHIWICGAAEKCFSGRYLPASTAVHGRHRRGVLPPVCGSHGVFHRCTNRRCGKNVGGGLPSHTWICGAVGKCFSGRYLPASTAVHGCHRRGVLPPGSGAG